MGRVLVGIIGVVVSAVWGVQDPRYFFSADRVSVRAMSLLAPVDVAPGVHVRTVVGTTGSVSVGEFESGSAAVLHHHTREQADVGVTGTFDMTIGTHVEKLGPDAGVIVPSNVDHSIANTGSSLMTVIEFHTVPRPDLVPPQPAMTFPARPEPVPVPDGRAFVVQLDQPGDKGAARTIRGDTCTLAWRPLLRGTRREIQAGAKELFMYILRGDADFGVMDTGQHVTPGAVIFIPPHQRVTIQATRVSDVAIVEFSTERR